MGDAPGVAVNMGGGATGGAIHVTGLREFRRDLRLAEASLPKELKRAFDEIGREILIPEILVRFDAALSDKPRNRARRSGKLRSSIRAVSKQEEGRILEGKAASPYAGWWEFGGSTKRRDGGVLRRILPEGRSLYPALEAKQAEIHEACENAMNEISDVLRRIV